MTKGKKAVVAAVAVAAAAAVGFVGFRFWKKNDDAAAKGKVFVTQVSELNTAGGITLSGSRFSGVIEAPKTEDYKFDSDKTVKTIEVNEGDEVKAGDVLFTYDVEAMRLQLDQGKIEVERMENEVETMKLQIEELEKEKKTTSQDGQTSLTTQILSLQSDSAKTEYDIKAKKAENKKLKKSIKNSEVKAGEDGTVKKVAELDNLQYAESNVVVSLSKGGDYQVKGTVNEQMVGNIYESMPVIIRSRVDDSVTWSGVVSGIETNPQTSSNDEMYYDGGEDSSANSSKYTFYVEPETLEGLMLGQHIIIEPDFGIENEIEKNGIWLYSDFVFKEEGKSYVWVRDSKEKIEKREVKIGQTDDDMGDCEIVSGLKKDDYIAYPSDNIVEGMQATTDADDPDIPEEDYNNDDMDTDMDGMIPDDMDYEDMDMGEFDMDDMDMDIDDMDDFDEMDIPEDGEPADGEAAPEEE